MSLNPLQRDQLSGRRRRWTRVGLGVLALTAVTGAAAATWPDLKAIGSPFLVGIGAGFFGLIAGLAAIGVPTLAEELTADD